VGIKVINPLHEPNGSAHDVLGADPHIVCSFFGDDWAKACGDKFYQQFVPEPEWTHLQVKKSDLLREIVFMKDTLRVSKGKVSRLSKVAKTEKFREWRESRENNVPTIPEDNAFMKQFGVGRDEVRELRKGYPRLARGRPKENKIGG